MACHAFFPSYTEPMMSPAMAPSMSAPLFARSKSSRLLQFLDADVAEADFQRLLLVADAVYLQGDEARRRHRVLDLRGRHAVEPRLDRVALALDAERVPVVLLERLAGRLVVLEVLQPAAPALVVDAARPGP